MPGFESQCPRQNGYVAERLRHLPVTEKIVGSIPAITAKNEEVLKRLKRPVSKTGRSTKVGAWVQIPASSPNCFKLTRLNGVKIRFIHGYVAERLRHLPVTEKIAGSIPAITAKWGVSSDGRIFALQAEGRRFKSATLHHFMPT